jgi:uncharacterized membrane protein
MTTPPARARTLSLHRLFAASMWLKGFDGALEIIGGLFLLLLSPDTLHSLVITLTQHELVEDPQDWVANALRATFAQMSGGSQAFGSAYLIAHGLLKIGVVICVLRGYRWAYPAVIGFLGLFIAYQLYRLSYAFSLGLLALTLFDLVIVGLTWREYRASARAA